MSVVTAAQLISGTSLPKSNFEGKLHMVWKDLGPDPSRPRILFAIRCKLAVESDYTFPSTSTAIEKLKSTFIIKIIIQGTSQTNLDRMTTDRAWLEKSVARTLSVSCPSGSRVESRETKEHGDVHVSIVALGACEISINGRRRVLLDASPPRWDFHDSNTPVPSVINNPAPPAHFRPLSSHIIPQLTFDANLHQKRPSVPDDGSSKRIRLNPPLPQPQPADIGTSSPEPSSRIDITGTPSEYSPANLSTPLPGGDNDFPAPSTMIFRPSEPDSIETGSSSGETSKKTMDRQTALEQMNESSVEPIAQSSLTEVQNVDLDQLQLSLQETERRRKAQNEEALKHRREAESKARAAAEACARREVEERIAREREAQRVRDDGIASLSRVFIVEDVIYKPLREVVSKTTVNVFGVIMSVGGIRKSGGRDYIMSIVITDPSTYSDDRSREDFVITIFRGTEREMAGLEPGLPVLFRNLKTSTFNDRVKGQAFSNSNASWTVLRAGAIVPSLAEPWQKAITTAPAEIARLQALDMWWRTHGEGSEAVAPSADQSVGQKKAILLGDVEAGVFFDATFKILHVHKNTQSGSRPLYELYVTDGSTHTKPTRNFHNIEARLPPKSILCLTIHSDPPPKERALLEPGNILHMPNVRCKEYRGELELAWSEKLTAEQSQNSWRNRHLSAIPNDDPRAVAIRRRIKALKHGGAVIATTNQQLKTPSLPSPSVPMAPLQPTLANHVGTEYTDPIAHPHTKLAAALANHTIPNRYRILARVAVVYGRGAKGSARDDLAVQWCSRCRRHFGTDYCQSCNDLTLSRAQWQWQMIVVLEDDESGTRLPVVLAGDEAARILPPLPLVPVDSAAVNEMRRARARVSELTPRAHDVLLGASFDGIRPRPIIDWSLESYVVQPPGGSKPVVVWRAFGMKKST